MLVIYLPSLDSGGAERQCINMSSSFLAAGFDVTILVDRMEGSLVSHVPEGVRLASLDAARTISAVVPLARFLGRENPDILMSNMGHPNVVAILARMLVRSRSQLTVCFHNHLSSEIKAKNSWKFKVLPRLLRLLLAKSDAIVAVSSRVADDLAEVANISRARITTIYNPAVPDDVQQKCSEEIVHPWLGDSIPVIVAVGRLVPQKDFSTLLRAFGKAIETRPARLLILGEGPLLGQLRAEATQLGVDAHVDFRGFVANPFAWMKRASLLVMSSRYEGFGNVVAEALACGTPVVSTDCQAGPAEILADGRFGELVPVGDAAEMAAAMVRAIDGAHDRTALIERGRQFTINAAVRKYQDLFASLAPGGASPSPAWRS